MLKKWLSDFSISTQVWVTICDSCLIIEYLSIYGDQYTALGAQTLAPKKQCLGFLF